MKLDLGDDLRLFSELAGSIETPRGVDDYVLIQLRVHHILFSTLRSSLWAYRTTAYRGIPPCLR